MKISIDSNEPLEDVLRVVGAAYNVKLAVEGPAEVPQKGTAKSDRVRRESPLSGQGRSASRNGSIGRSKASKNRTEVTNAELRSWARENGQIVSDRGRVPSTVIAAYRQAH